MILASDLGTQAVDLVVGALDTDDVGSEDQRAKNLGRLEVGRDQDKTAKPCSRGVGCHRVRKISGRSAGHRVDAEFFGPAERDRDDAVLKRKGGVIYGVILDVEFIDAKVLRQAPGADQRSEPGLETDCRFVFDGEEFSITPHRTWA